MELIEQYKEIVQSLNEYDIGYFDKDGLFVRYYELIKLADRLNDIHDVLIEYLGVDLDTISDDNVIIRGDKLHGRIIIDKVKVINA